MAPSVFQGWIRTDGRLNRKMKPSFYASVIKIIIDTKVLIWVFWYMRGRLMSNSFKLNARAEKWINAMRKEFKAEPLETFAAHKNQALEIGGFKML